MSKKFVAIIMGSDSDLPLIENTLKILDKLGVPYEVRVSSAHRTPDDLAAFVGDAEARGAQAFICAAGLAAHLAGAVAARTMCPVIGIPVDGGPLSGIDALYSTVMMPGGIPVATVAVGKAGARNAAYLAAQIMALSDAALRERLVADRKEAAQAVLDKSAALQSKLGLHA